LCREATHYFLSVLAFFQRAKKHCFVLFFAQLCTCAERCRSNKTKLINKKTITKVKPQRQRNKSILLMSVFFFLLQPPKERNKEKSPLISFLMKTTQSPATAKKNSSPRANQTVFWLHVQPCLLVFC
jgi:hypothetical protein